MDVSGPEPSTAIWCCVLVLLETRQFFAIYVESLCMLYLNALDYTIGLNTEARQSYAVMTAIDHSARMTTASPSLYLVVMCLARCSTTRLLAVVPLVCRICPEGRRYARRLMSLAAQGRPTGRSQAAWDKAYRSMGHVLEMLIDREPV